MMTETSYSEFETVTQWEDLSLYVYTTNKLFTNITLPCYQFSGNYAIDNVQILAFAWM